MSKIRRRLGPLGLFFFVLSLLVWLAIPDFPGLAVLPALAGLLSLTLYLPGHLGSDLARLKRPGALILAAGLLSGAVLTAALSLAGGWLNQTAPRLDLSPSRAWTLSPRTLEVLDRLPPGLTLEALLAPHNPGLFQIQEMLAAYGRRNPNLRLTIEFEASKNAGPGRLPDLAGEYLKIANAEGYDETLYPPFSEARLTAALARAAKPKPDLIYFLQAENSKAPEDRSHKGLSEWAAALAAYRLLGQSYLWPAARPELPAEPALVVLAGARAALGAAREEALRDYLRKGGRVFLLVDPLTEALSSEFLRHYGLTMPEGVLWDPHTTMALSNETLITIADYPRHAANAGLSQPSLWPLAGVILTSSHRPKAEEAVTVWALAQSSAHAWLETDLDKLAQGLSRYDPALNRPGPLVTGVAVEIGNEAGPPGRMVILTDSDLASNGFIAALGNRDFLVAVTAWLAEDLAWLPAAPSTGQVAFTVSRLWLRLIFWLMAVAAPLAAVGAWGLFYRRRR